MIKLLIVDDFLYDREDTLHIIDWKSVDVEVIGAVENGSQALAFIQSDKPDIILTDIKMPDMDGVQFTRLIKACHPEIKIIFMSCFTEFRYAKDALKLYVLDYISKPLLKDEVYEVMKRVCTLIEAERKEIREKEQLRVRLQESFPLLRERFLRNLLLGARYRQEKLWEQLEYLGIDIKRGVYQLILLEIDEHEYAHTGFSQEDMQLFGMQLSDMARKSSFPDAMNVFLIQTDHMHYVQLIHHARPISLQEAETQGDTFAQAVMSSLDKFAHDCITAVVGNVFCELGNISRHYNSCLDGVKHRFFIGRGQLIFLKDIRQRNETASIDLNRIKQDLKSILLSEDENTIEEFIGKCFDKTQENLSENSVKNLVYGMVVCLQLILAEFNTDYGEVFGEDAFVWNKLIHFETILDIRKWLCNLLTLARRYLVDKNRSSSNKIVQAVKRYVDAHLKEDITLQMLASEVYISPNYLNLLFKNRTGETIPEYIARVRLEKAKKLLEDPRLKLYEVIEKVGYSHLPHFNSIFKKYMGMTPREYRNSL